MATPSVRHSDVRAFTTFPQSARERGGVRRRRHSDVRAFTTFPPRSRDRHGELVACRAENELRLRSSFDLVGLLGEMASFSQIKFRGYFHTERAGYFNDLSQASTSVAGCLIALDLLGLDANSSRKLTLSHMRHDSCLYQQVGQITQRRAFRTRHRAAPQRSVCADIFLELDDATLHII